jgi:hypothetical protein
LIGHFGPDQTLSQAFLSAAKVIRDGTGLQVRLLRDADAKFFRDGTANVSMVDIAEFLTRHLLGTIDFNAVENAEDLGVK